MSAVIVRNASYEIISRTSVARAINLVLRGDAVIEEFEADKLVRHANGHFPWPTLIRLLRYVKVPFRMGVQPWSKSGVMRRDKHTCAYCSKAAKTVDHIMPTSRGGAPRDWLNTVAACVKCNGKKADRTPEEAGMVLKITPTSPLRMQLLI